jgi:glycine cleavage system aminomethyltransferase T
MPTWSGVGVNVVVLNAHVVRRGRRRGRAQRRRGQASPSTRSGLAVDAVRPHRTRSGLALDAARSGLTARGRASPSTRSGLAVAAVALNIHAVGLAVHAVGLAADSEDSALAPLAPRAFGYDKRGDRSTQICNFAPTMDHVAGMGAVAKSITITSHLMR